MDGWFKLPPGAVPAPGDYMWRLDPLSPQLRVYVNHGVCRVGHETRTLYGGEWRDLQPSTN